MSKRWSGGLYVIRTDKPSAVLGLPFIGRHFGYSGMTNSYYHRQRQHLQGGGKYGAVAKSWSDLRPRFYRVLPLPDLITKTWLGRKLVLVPAEWLLHAVTLPVYGERPRIPWNLRKIKPAAAARQRAARDRLGPLAKLRRFIIRQTVFAMALLTLAVVAYQLMKGGQ